MSEIEEGATPKPGGHDDERGSDTWWRACLVGRVAPLRGLSDIEVEEVGFYQGVELPTAYANFLRIAGGQLGEHWVGSDVFHPELLGLRVAFMRSLERSGVDFRLGPDDVVIGMHRRREFVFISGKGPDPPVYRYVEGDVAPVRIFERFTDLIEREIR